MQREEWRRDGKGCKKQKTKTKTVDVIVIYDERERIDLARTHAVSIEKTCYTSVPCNLTTLCNTINRR